MNAQFIFNYNLKLPNFEILFFKLPNHFLHFNKLLVKRVPKLLVTYGMCFPNLYRFKICTTFTFLKI